MKYLIVISIALFAYTLADESPAKAEVKIIGNITEFRNANPRLKITQMKSAVNPRLNQIVYSVGSRYSGDRLVAADSGWAVYPSKQNVELRVWYPTSGVGAIVSYLQVVVRQDTGTTGRGYVVYGGVGQRSIQILIEAWNTAYIDYNYAVYGV